MFGIAARSGYNPAGVKLRTNLRRAYILLLVVAAEPTPLSLAAGLGLVYPFAFLHFTASGFLAKQQFVVSAGPYRFMRHPFYVANFFMDLGFGVVASGLGPSAAAALALGYLLVFYGRVIPRRVEKEESEMRARFGELYEDYARRVPRFLPNVFSTLGPRGKFTLANLRRNGELPRVVSNAILPYLIFLAGLFKAADLDFRAVIHSADGPLVCGIVLGGFVVSTALHWCLRGMRAA
jgi:protein-S-isoprenylcysteine O-methyltransferase Ste14